MSSKKEELSPKAKGHKITYERWFYGVLIGFALGGASARNGSPIAIIPLIFAVYCLFESQKNYKLYKAALNENQTPANQWPHSPGNSVYESRCL
ncbi:hypothetical protein [Methanomassiliicoccus luminyensis]|jgi:hypothetical protein|uniref:hypothetical protein n=1 Tax=Methanomassiliicoccus luminyensis TaxID=1080712 RepID=UPI00036D8967|nr:hypothetical protein [Methanomassiliicoccus luminyensis]